MKPTRRRILHTVAALGAGSGVAQPLNAALAAAPALAAAMQISRFEVIPTHVPMYGPVRRTWQESYVQQERFEFYYARTLVKSHTDKGSAGIGNAGIEGRGRLEAILKRMVGHSP